MLTEQESIRLAVQSFTSAMMSVVHSTTLTVMAKVYEDAQSSGSLAELVTKLHAATKAANGPA